ncbi:MAG: sigma-54-dependent Fis family transcriptional regulator [Nitrospirae bacterium]|nr:sigma-54-dependent Fis family transcriptional regulator [Nitrospirota bacterium]
MTVIDDKLRILLVDDEKNIRMTLQVTLSDMGHHVIVAASLKEAADALKSETFDLILTDFRLGGPTGIDVIREAKGLQSEAIIVVMTAYSSIENAVQVTKEGAFDYLPKPFTNAQLSHLLEKVRTLVSLKRENEALKNERYRPEYFLGFVSPAMQRLEAFVNQVAPTDETVLITGENGTGKTELARLIHNRSRRAKGPFITVSCTTLAESVLESELFGHVKGSFTGAVADKMGKLELAHDGTLFLDEIGDLSSSAQARLLRFLQEKVIERVGGIEEIKVDTRIIAATNHDLHEATANRNFREDLYYRLNILECCVVPLRYRKEDIPVLVHRFIKKAAVRQGKTAIESVPDAIMQKFLDYDWPGNIRELKNTVERIVILTNGPQFEESALPPAMLSSRGNRAPEQAGLKTIEEMEREHIAAVLASEQNLEKAAEILGITTVTLWRKRKQYGIP